MFILICFNAFVIGILRVNLQLKRFVVAICGNTCKLGSHNGKASL